MRIADKTYISKDDYNPTDEIKEKVAKLLESLQLEPWNKVYVVRIIVDEVD